MKKILKNMFCVILAAVIAITSPLNIKADAVGITLALSALGTLAGSIIGSIAMAEPGEDIVTKGIEWIASCFDFNGKANMDKVVNNGEYAIKKTCDDFSVYVIANVNNWQSLTLDELYSIWNTSQVRTDNIAAFTEYVRTEIADEEYINSFMAKYIEAMDKVVYVSAQQCFTTRTDIYYDENGSLVMPFDFYKQALDNGLSCILTYATGETVTINDGHGGAGMHRGDIIVNSCFTENGYEKIISSNSHATYDINDLKQIDSSFREIGNNYFMQYEFATNNRIGCLVLATDEENNTYYACYALGNASTRGIISGLFAAGGNFNVKDTDTVTVGYEIQKNGQYHTYSKINNEYLYDVNNSLTFVDKDDNCIISSNIDIKSINTFAYDLAVGESKEIYIVNRLKQMLKSDLLQYIPASYTDIGKGGLSDIEKAAIVSGIQSGALTSENKDTYNPTVTVFPETRVDENGNTITTIGTNIKIDENTKVNVEEKAAEYESNLNLKLDVPNIFLDKFPFCLPFDLYKILTCFVYPEKKPIFTVPIKTTITNGGLNYEIDEKIELDFTIFQINGVDILKVVLNFGSVAAFTVFLIKQTTKFFV